IGKAERKIEGELSEWTRIAVPFEYYSSNTPEKLNIIISSSNYYSRLAIGGGNTLWVDDVELVSKSTGIAAINEELTLYTQPGELYVNSDKPGSLTIYTLQGSVWLQKNIAAGQTSISLPKGLYIVKINNIARKVLIK
ncbi:MAG: T9SS type A sorting domain-containing protein, partial [Tannerellaceae bacterium]|nr:T9SS type A sorting domain-containing protein [Tannerellaceae bacterium]